MKVNKIFRAKTEKEKKQKNDKGFKPFSCTCDGYGACASFGCHSECSCGTCTETREVEPLGPAEVELSFVDDDVRLVVPRDATPKGSVFSVLKIVPPPSNVVDNIHEQHGQDTEVLTYYEIRLADEGGTPIIYLDGEITVKIKMSDYLSYCCIQMFQENEAGEFVIMQSYWEGEYLCYKTDWLETYH